MVLAYMLKFAFTLRLQLRTPLYLRVSGLGLRVI